MTLPMRDRRILAEIEQCFLADDPELAILLGTFGEVRPRRRWRLLGPRRRVVALAYAAVAASAVLLVAACAARSVILLCAAGAMVLLSAAPFLLRARLRNGSRRESAGSGGG
ncbi:hypothetical protein ADL22_10650 [Streptomyces sp. NRRL F-4489]|uniref:DUF3040 domain-containing protein n=1 Tax=Streptomyces sp. NRRL F-4489 TaxID=1609095 RepID=UPI0007498CB4|nr:DUF3040 domain-containing protein [Streptomyces sp. NRRL F-4489]KUL45984.1 hypothetical protein ADL22_10650 [Streptomyces sp. NRRL F-4489]